MKSLEKDQLKSLSRSDLIDLFLGEQDLRLQAHEANSALQSEVILLGEKYVRIKNRIFSPSSEKGHKHLAKAKDKKPRPKRKTLKPSERYPNVPVEEQDIELQELPHCPSCDQVMTDSGLSEITETLTVVPRKFQITRNYHHKYHCRCCHGSMITAPRVNRIKPSSSYSDEMIVDVTLAKYCDLIPIERYRAMAERHSDVCGLPAQSLIELTHYMAEYLNGIYKKIKNEVFSASVLHADETTHRMLEGDDRKSWYLWGFSSEKSCYFELHGTRSGAVASEVLIQSSCQYLVSDVFSGYSKATKDANIKRAERDLPIIENCYCNAHARRYFNEMQDDESNYFLESYERIYQLDKESRNNSLDRKDLIEPIFISMKSKAELLIDSYSNKSSAAKALKYFTKNYQGLTKFLDNTSIPIDNNHQERLLRNPVVGRKTWYGTHSKRGAKTAAVLFSIIESCKLNGLNPRKYMQEIITRLHSGKAGFTPHQAARDQLL